MTPPRMPSLNAIAPPPSTARFQLSAVNSRLFCSKPFSFTHFRKNASANPLDSHSFKTKDLKPFRFIHFQKSGGGPLVKAVIPTGYLPRASDGRAAGALRPTPPSHLPTPAMLELPQTLQETHSRSPPASRQTRKPVRP